MGKPKLKMQTIRETSLKTIAAYFDKYVDEIQAGYEDGDSNVKISFPVTIKKNEKGQIVTKTEINFVKTRVKDEAQVKYDPDQIMFGFEDEK